MTGKELYTAVVAAGGKGKRRQKSKYFVWPHWIGVSAEQVPVWEYGQLFGREQRVCHGEDYSSSHPAEPRIQKW